MNKYIANLDINNFIFSKKLFIHLIEKCGVSFYYYDKKCNKIKLDSCDKRVEFIELIKNNSINIYTLTGPVFWHNKNLLPIQIQPIQLEERLFYIIKQNDNIIMYISEPEEWEECYMNMSYEELAVYDIQK